MVRTFIPAVLSFLPNIDHTVITAVIIIATATAHLRDGIVRTDFPAEVTILDTPTGTNIVIFPDPFLVVVLVITWIPFAAGGRFDHIRSSNDLVFRFINRGTGCFLNNYYLCLRGLLAQVNGSGRFQSSEALGGPGVTGRAGG